MNIIKFKGTNFEGEWAAPKDHPVTCANPAPWLITEVKIDHSSEVTKVWIRGEGSMWFRIDQCYIAGKEELTDWVSMKEGKDESQ